MQLTPTLSLFGRYGLRNLDDRRSAEHSAAVGRRRQRRTSTRATGSSCSASTWAPTAAIAARSAASAGRGRRPARIRRRSASDSALDQFGLPGLPTDPRIAGGLPTQLITGYSDLGRQATNPQWQYPTVYNPKVNYTWLTGAQSFKTGYEFQRINTEVQDVNPLYGRDTYNGQFTRPAGAAVEQPLQPRRLHARPALAVRAQQRPRRATCAGTCTSPTCRTTGASNDRLTLNLGLRYEYATPILGERQHPVELRSGDEHDGHREGRIDCRSRARQSRSQQLRAAPRLRLHADARTRSSAAATASATCTSAAPAAATCCRSTARRSSTRSSTRPIPTAPSFVPAEQGYPAGLADPSQFNPLTANITYMPRDFHSSPVQSWYISVQRELGAQHAARRRLRRQPRRRPAAVRQLQPGVPEQRRRHDSARRTRRPIPTFADITYAFNGGKSRYKALQTKFEWRDEPRRHAPELADAVARRRTTASQSLENSNGNFPAPQDFRNLDADFGLSDYDQPYNSTTSFVWALPFGRGQRWGSDASPAHATR